jgi:hypothetical protein
MVEDRQVNPHHRYPVTSAANAADLHGNRRRDRSRPALSLVWRITEIR